MNLKPITPIFFSLILLPSVGYGQKETREVAEFSKVSLRTAGTVHITQGDTYSVVVEASDKVLESLETVVNDGKLIIGQEGKWWNWSVNDDLDVYITMRDIEGLGLSSSGKILGQNKFKTGDLDLSLSGSGRIEVETASEDLKASISGSGKLIISGSCDAIKVSISGSGRISAENMSAKTCRANISGSGNARVNVSEALGASISGSGGVHYLGDPDHVNSKVSGSGSVKKISGQYN